MLLLVLQVQVNAGMRASRIRNTWEPLAVLDLDVLRKFRRDRSRGTPIILGTPFCIPASIVDFVFPNVMI